MKYKQQIMNLIMSGNYQYVEVKKEKKTFQANCFVYHGEYFQCYFKQKALKLVGELVLFDIKECEIVAPSSYKITYEEGESVRLTFKKKKAKK